MERQATSRRDFLCMTMTAAAAACTGCALVGSRKPDVVADSEDDTVRLSKAESSELLNGEGSLLVAAKGSDRKILVVHLKDGRLFAVNAICTHMGCTVGYKKETGRIVCPCHGSRFGLDGSILKGPAKSPLSRYDVRTENGQVVVTL
jgi:cytochrome b6-f complex iron-sulfur subunit